MSPSPVCVIGNSHIVAVKDGWPIAKDVTAGLEPTYVAAPGNYLSRMRLENGRLVPATLQVSTLVELTSGNIPYVEVARFDAFLLVGLLLRFASVLRIYDSHRLPEHANVVHSVVSPSVLRATIGDLIEETALYLTASRIRQVSDAPVVAIAEPFISELVLGKAKLSRMWTIPGREQLYGIYMEVIREKLEPLGVIFVPQPEHTVQQMTFTRGPYLDGANKIWRGKPYKPGSDLRHMNGEFGAAMLRAAIPALRRGP